MAGLFISYRRKDAGDSAGRLFDSLARCFGKSLVFMDIEGGIPRGADFAKELKAALNDCNALLAIIGPIWLNCTRSDGRRRLDVPDDWVRTEIVTALSRNIPVIPVTVGKASLPDGNSLPAELRPLLDAEAADITDTRWAYDVVELAKDLVECARLPLVDDVMAADIGIRMLRDLTAVPQVQSAVSRSKEIVENAHHRLHRLELLKRVHDALHGIEFDCLRAMQAAHAQKCDRGYKTAFDSYAGEIAQALQTGELTARLRDSLTDQLALTSAALEANVKAPNQSDFKQLIGELNRLVAKLPPEVDADISHAAEDLGLDRLVDLMSTVQQVLAATASIHNRKSELFLSRVTEPFLQSIEALSRLRAELNARVVEHGQLQNLDKELRALYVWKELTGDWWRHVRCARDHLVAPYSPELGKVIPDLESVESDIETALARNDEPAARKHLGEYFYSVSSVFRRVDTALKDVCLRLGAVSQSLEAVLEKV